MRLFTALDIPPELVSQLDHLLAALRPEAPINWSPLENLHITTKFIGEWPEARLDQLDQALSSLKERAAFVVAIHDLGWHPNASSPKVLWAGIHGGPSLIQLAADTDEHLTSLGLSPEARPYSPHLTLARIKGSVSLQNLRTRVDQSQPADVGTFVASKFYLYRSDPGSNSSIYRKLREYPFQAAIGAQQTT